MISLRWSSIDIMGKSDSICRFLRSSRMSHQPHDNLPSFVQLAISQAFGLVRSSAGRASPLAGRACDERFCMKRIEASYLRFGGTVFMSSLAGDSLSVSYFYF